MDAQRIKLYEAINDAIGWTPLLRYGGELPHGHALWIKRECENPFGSHYDRVYAALFKHFELLGKIKPGDKVLETTSGAAGVSFAGIGRDLGYDCYVALPAGGEKAREEAIKALLPSSDHLILTPAEKYISGFPLFLKRFLVEHRDYFFLNHSMGPYDRETKHHANNDVTLKALAGIDLEVRCQLRNQKGMDSTHPDIFLPAVGNGSSVLGPGRHMKRWDACTGGKHTSNIVGFESFQSAVAYGQLHPGDYEERFGISPGTLSRHRLPGTSFQGIDFPHIRHAVSEGVLDDVALVSDAKIDAEYFSLTGRTDTTALPHWDMPLSSLAMYGRTTRAGVAVALDLAGKLPGPGKNMIVIAYDRAERYDS